MSASRQQPSRASRHSLQTGPERINEQYRTASRAQSIRTPEIEITRVDSGPIASPTAQRIIPPLAVPGAYNTSHDQAGPSHRTTIEVVTDPDEPTIRQPEPGDMSVLPNSPRPAQRSIPVFTQPSQVDLPPSNEGSAVAIHPLTGTHINRPIRGYPGAQMVGPPTTASAQSTLSLRSPLIVHLPPSEPGHGDNRAHSQIEPPSRQASVFIPQQEGQGNANLYAFMLRQIEDNLRQELGARLMPLAETNRSVQAVQRTVAEAMNRIARLNEIEQNANNELTLIRGNGQQTRTEVGYVSNQIRGLLGNIQHIERIQQEQGEDIRRILDNMDHFNERLANLNVLIQEEVGGLHEQIQAQGGFNPQGHSTWRDVPRPESRHSVRRMPSPRWPSPVQRIPSPRRLLPRQEDEEARIPKDARQKCPEPFNGKKGSEAETFMLCLEMFFDEYPTIYSDDRRRIKRLLSTMKEGTSASTWAKSLLQRIRAGDWTGPLTSWETMHRAFNTAFGNPNKRNKAISDIQELTQKGSAQQYATAFRIIAQELDWPERPLIDVFIRNLKPHVRNELLKLSLSGIDTDAMSLDEWIEHAVKTDDVLYEGRKGQEAGSNKRAFSGKAASMEDEKKPKRFGTKDWVSEQEIALRNKERRCYRCGSNKHQKAECPDKYLNNKYTPKTASGRQGTIEEVEGDTSESENA